MPSQYLDCDCYAAMNACLKCQKSTQQLLDSIYATATNNQHHKGQEFANRISDGSQIHLYHLITKQPPPTHFTLPQNKVVAATILRIHRNWADLILFT